MQAASRTTLFYQVSRAFILGGGVALISEAADAVGWPLGVLVFAAALWAGLRKPLRRTRALRRPLPVNVRRWLDAFFPWKDAVDMDRLEGDMKILLDEWTFEGVGGVDVTEPMKAGVVAGAALLLHGRPTWELPRRQTVLFYPERFGADYATEETAEFDGMAHQQGPIIVSALAVEESWADPHDGSNVVLHELAHLLDYENEFADGVPSLLDPGSAVAWQELVSKETRRIRIGRSMLRRYAATNRAEFFAVAVENFFERGDVMQGRHPELYAALKALFRLDPAQQESMVAD